VPDTELKREFSSRDNELAKVVELSRVEQGLKIIERFYENSKRK